MRIRCLVAVLLGLCCAASAQLSGRFYLEKDTYAPGEPVFLMVEITNSGAKAENIHSADPYSFCSGYDVSISGEPDENPDSSCGSPIFGGSCLSSSEPVPARKSITQRYLLNYEHDLRKPGVYQVHAIRSISHQVDDVPFFSAAKKHVLKIETDLHFSVDEHATADTARLASLVAQLKSRDEMVRIEAARALASVAPIELETTLIGFATDPTFKRFAPLALHNLNTPRSLSAMAELMTKSELGGYENMESARYLAETGDPQWFPLLRQLGLQRPEVSNYLTYAAESGGDDAVPLLLELLDSPDVEYIRLNAIAALGDTDSRAAVPVLLGLLRDATDGVSQRALGALQTLTHRRGSERYSEHPQSQYVEWSQWWSREGKVAPIFKAKDCGPLDPLR